MILFIRINTIVMHVYIHVYIYYVYIKVLCCGICIYMYMPAELIKQEKKKLTDLQASHEITSKDKGDSLLNVDHKLLRQLVMSSITQLAEIAYDVGSLDQETDSDLDRIDDSDMEVGGGDLRTARSDASRREQQPPPEGGEVRGHQRKGVRSEVKVHGDIDGAEDVEKVSDKMKKMADNVKNDGKDSALESLLANLAVTAQYIESLENEGDENTPSTELQEEVSGTHQEPSEDDDHEFDGGSSDGDEAVRGPPTLESGREASGTSGSDTHKSPDKGRRSVSSEILAASGLEMEEEEEEEFELDPELVKEMEQQLEETLAKQLDTKGRCITPPPLDSPS